MVLKIFAKIFLQVQDIVICSTQGAMFLSISLHHKGEILVPSAHEITIV